MTTEERIARLEKELVELKESIKKEDENNQFCWKPEFGERYYFIPSYEEHASNKWDNHPIDERRLAIGNVFKTKKEANFAIEKLKVIHELQQFAEPKEKAWDSEDAHFYIEWDFTFGRINIDRKYTRKGNCIYFDTVYMAENAIKAVGEDRIKKYYLEVE